jgi:hypothetical protein
MTVRMPGPWSRADGLRSHTRMTVMNEPLPPDHPAMRLLRSGERIRTHIPAKSTTIVVTDERIAVADEERIALDIEIHRLRRIQFDIERERPATLVIVPEHPTHEPQVLAIPPEHYHEVGEALAYIGQRLYHTAP